MSREFVNKSRDRFLRVIKLLGTFVGGCAVLTMVVAGESESGTALKLTYSIQAITQIGTDPKCAQPNEAFINIEGAGQANLLGPLHVAQHHCVVVQPNPQTGQPELLVEQGVAILTGARLGPGLPQGGEDSEDSITGQYRARAVPTIASVQSLPPGGFWLGYGEFCVWKGKGRFESVINDCPTAESPGRFFPARITQDFSTRQVNVFGIAIVRLRQTE
jgi:hypothetical protein